MFYGREEDIADLMALWRKPTASLVTCRGRRRIGKSTLIEEFARRSKAKFIEIAGEAPRKGMTDDDQLKAFGRQLAAYVKEGSCSAPGDWAAAFRTLDGVIGDGRTIVFLDEISWMGQYAPDFPGDLKTAWDTRFKKHPRLILVLCGSVSTWICEKILNLNRDEPETKPQIFIFGFSRGAYRAHAFSWLLQTYGIPLKYTACRPVAKAFIDHNDNVIPTLLKDGVLPSPEITMLGLWDIVSAPLDAKKHYNDGCRPPKVLNIYHAMAANERRLNFPVLQYSPHGKGIEQMWFPGAHSDVGGGYPVNERALSNQCYNWMKEKAYNLGLDFLVPPKKIKNHTAIIGNLNEMHDESLPLTPNNREFLSGERVHKNVKNMMHYFKNYTTFVNDFPSMRFSRYFNL